MIGIFCAGKRVWLSSATLSLLIREKEGVWSKWLWVPTSTSVRIAATDRKKQIIHLSLFYHLDFWYFYHFIPRFRYLRKLGASEILHREQVSADNARPLEAQRWAGSIDTVGGTTLAYLMRSTKKGGAIAAIGVAGGAAFHATVYPLILRGIKVPGIDMPSTPLPVRHELWQEVTREKALLRSADAIISEVTLEHIPQVSRAMPGGQTQGRILVRPAGEQ